MDGDHLVTTGYDDPERRKPLMAVCYRLASGGAERIWALPPGIYPGYRSPVIYRDRVYLSADILPTLIPPDSGFPMPRGARGKAIYCLDLATGEVLAADAIDNNCSSWADTFRRSRSAHA
ncbi:MAG: hypothetical protein ACOCYP_06540 [Planctomycetota bacterium]